MKGVISMRKTAIIQGKGGVGKTTTTDCCVTGVKKARKNRSVSTLAIDYDPQGNLSFLFNTKVDECPTMYHVLNGDVTIQEAIQHTERGDIIVGNGSLAKIESLYSEYEDGLFSLKEQLALLDQEYDYVFIDNQPAISGYLTKQALIAADDLVVPVTAEVLTLQGLAKVGQTVERVKKHYNPDLLIDGLLLTRHNQRTTIAKQLEETVREWAIQLQTKAYKTFIRETVSLREAQAKKVSIFEYAPDSNPAKDYNAFIKEYLNSERK